MSYSVHIIAIRAVFEGNPPLPPPEILVQNRVFPSKITIIYFSIHKWALIQVSTLVTSRLAFHFLRGFIANRRIYYICLLLNMTRVTINFFKKKYTLFFLNEGGGLFLRIPVSKSINLALSIVISDVT